MDDMWRQAVEMRLIATETRNAVDDVHRQNVEKRLANIEDALKWLVRLIIGGMVAAVLAYVMRGGFSIT